MSTDEETSILQQTRVYRVATLGTGIFVHLVMCWILFAIGALDLAPAGLLALSGLAIAGFFLMALLIGIEWNLTLKDPDMVTPQMLWALTVVVVTSHFAVELKPILLFVGLALIAMGANRLTRNQQVFISVYGLAIYLSSAFYGADVETMDIAAEAVMIIAFGFVLVFSPALQRFDQKILDRRIRLKSEELDKALERIKEMTTHDELTGVRTGQYLMDALNQEKALSDRSHYGFSVCYVDLDYFKLVNQKFGHRAGDSLLKNFAAIALQHTREVDCVARVGGETFILVLSDTRESEATVCASRLQNSLKDIQVSHSEPHYRTTASIGIAEYHNGETILELLERSAGAMGDAKRAGRNRIVLAAGDNGNIRSLRR